MKKWIREHPEWAQIAAQAAMVGTAVLLGVGLSRTFKADAQEHVDKANAKIDGLKDENLKLWKFIDAQREAGVEFVDV